MSGASATSLPTRSSKSSWVNKSCPTAWSQNSGPIHLILPPSVGERSRHVHNRSGLRRVYVGEEVAGSEKLGLARKVPTTGFLRCETFRRAFLQNPKVPQNCGEGWGSPDLFFWGPAWFPHIVDLFAVEMSHRNPRTTPVSLCQDLI